jgi:hypothetical protein
MDTTVVVHPADESFRGAQARKLERQQASMAFDQGPLRGARVASLGVRSWLSRGRGVALGILRP